MDQQPKCKHSNAPGATTLFKRCISTGDTLPTPLTWRPRDCNIFDSFIHVYCFESLICRWTVDGITTFTLYMEVWHFACLSY